MARTAQQNAKSAAVKSLAADVIAERSREMVTMRSTYEKRYGQTPPAWPGPQAGGGPRHGENSSGPGMGGYGTMGGPGVMGAPGVTGGPGMMDGDGQGPGTPGGPVGARGSTGSAYGPMDRGDSYQMMMGGGGPNWWGSSNPDDAFVPALIRLDDMEISMAKLGLTSSDAATKGLAQRIVSARSDELSMLSKHVTQPGR